MSEFEHWICDTFRRSGNDLVVGPVRHAIALHREQAEALIAALREMVDPLPDLDARLAGLGVCPACDGGRVVHDIEGGVEADCPRCEGAGLAPRGPSPF